jgi:hypothetical protein
LACEAFLPMLVIHLIIAFGTFVEDVWLSRIS